MAKHAHLYGRRGLYSGKYIVWACYLPGCNHYQPINTPDEFMEGKESNCWSCGKRFTLNRATLEYDRPCCSEKCQNEYAMQEELLKATNPPPSIHEEPNTMCPKCGIRLKYGSLNWCWQCTMG
jgi:endogenous inhibitor of DNA gyrase (YacG/DUF329 family)